MLRHGSRRAFRLVRVAAPGSCLSVLTGSAGTGFSRGRARAPTRAGALDAGSVKTSRRRAFPLVGGLVSVLTGHETDSTRGRRA